MYPGRIAPELKTRGWHVFGIALHGSRVAKKFEDENIQTLTFKSDLTAVLSIKKILEYLRENDISVIHAHKSGDVRVAALIAQFRPDIRIFFTDHMGAKKPKKDLYHRWAYSKMDNVFSISQATYRWNLTSLPISSDRLIQLYYGIDLKAYAVPLTVEECSEVRDSLGISNKGVVIALPGRIDKSKGHEVWLRALQLLSEDSTLPAWQAVIIGEASGKDSQPSGFEDELKTFVDSTWLSDRVSFAGFRSDLPRCLQAVDISCIPSACEAFGLSVIESMAAECAVVGSSTGAIPELVGFDRGRIADPTDAEQWRDAIKELLLNDDLRRRLGVAGSRWVAQKFSMDLHIEHLVSYYESRSL